MHIAAITASRDRQDKLSLVIDCINNQTLKPDIWVIVDDSKDALPADFFDKLVIPHKYIHQNQTLPSSTAWNTALALDNVRSEIYVMIDDDDYYPPTYLENAISFFSSDTDELIGNKRWPDYRLADPSYRVRLTGTTAQDRGLAEWRQTLIKGEKLKYQIYSLFRQHPTERFQDCLLRDTLMTTDDQYHLYDFGEEHSSIGLKGYGDGKGVIDAHKSSDGFTPDPGYAILRKWMGKDIERYRKYF